MRERSSPNTDKIPLFRVYCTAIVLDSHHKLVISHVLQHIYLAITSFILKQFKSPGQLRKEKF